MEYSAENSKLLIATNSSTLIQIELLEAGVEAAVNGPLKFQFWSLSGHEAKVVQFSMPLASNDFH